MAKRFTDTDLWKTQRWFRKLKPEYKLAFCYIKDQCNHSGVWKIDCSDLIDDLGFDTFNLVDFVTATNVEYDKMTGDKTYKERLRIVNENILWITGFIQFQYQGKDGKINYEVAAVRTALVQLQGLMLLDEGLQKGYITLNKPFVEGWQTHKDKDKDKDKDSTEGGLGETKKTIKPKNQSHEQTGKFSGNFKAQAEELFAHRISRQNPKPNGR